MNIAELHQKLHPKLKPYSGTGTSYRHRLFAGMDITIKKNNLFSWVVEVHERGELISSKSLNSESSACEEALKIASSQ